MEHNDIAWQSELSRRARIYEDIEAGDRFESGVAGLHLKGPARGQLEGTDPRGPIPRAPRPRRADLVNVRLGHPQSATPPGPASLAC